MIREKLWYCFAMDRFDELVAQLRAEGPRETWVSLGVEAEYSALREAAVAAGDDVQVATFGGVGAVLVGRPGMVSYAGDQYQRTEAVARRTVKSGAGVRARSGALAAAMRGAGGEWVELGDGAEVEADEVSSGARVAYRPAGSFEAEVRDGVVWGRFVGRGSGRPSRYPHAEWVAEMKEHEGAWVKLEGVPLPYSSTIPNGRPVAYAPAGAFEAQIREGAVWARFGGDGGGGGRPTRYPHEAWAAAMREREGEWVELEGAPWSYVSRIKHGLPAAYAPAGAFDARLQRGVVWARFGGGERARHQVKYPHAEWAAEMKARPGEWLQLPDVQFTYASLIPTGRPAAYAPRGAFEARVRGGVVEARWVVGGDGGA